MSEAVRDGLRHTVRHQAAVRRPADSYLISACAGGGSAVIVPRTPPGAVYGTMVNAVVPNRSDGGPTGRGTVPTGIAGAPTPRRHEREETSTSMRLSAGKMDVPGIQAASTAARFRHRSDGCKPIRMRRARRTTAVTRGGGRSISASSSKTRPPARTTWVSPTDRDIRWCNNRIHPPRR